MNKSTDKRTKEPTGVNMYEYVTNGMKQEVNERMHEGRKKWMNGQVHERQSNVRW